MSGKICLLLVEAHAFGFRVDLLADLAHHAHCVEGLGIGHVRRG
jgi:hypothetical protein